MHVSGILIYAEIGLYSFAAAKLKTGDFWVKILCSDVAWYIGQPTFD